MNRSKKKNHLGGGEGHGLVDHLGHIEVGRGFLLLAEYGPEGA